MYGVTSDEKEVCEALDAMWGKLGEASGVLVELGRRNQGFFRFEKMLEG